MRTKIFVKQSEIAAPVEAVFAFHKQPDALARLTPPWENVEIIEQPDSLQPGSITVLRLALGPVGRLWVAEVVEYCENSLFADIQRKGPFAYWYHRHRFTPTDQGKTIYRDEIEYALPFGLLGGAAAGRFVRARLDRTFEYRHRKVAEIMSRRPSSGEASCSCVEFER